MHFRKVLLSVGIGFLAASALPHNGANSQPRGAPFEVDSVRQIEERTVTNATSVAPSPALNASPTTPDAPMPTLGALVPISISIGSGAQARTVLHVPFLYAGWVDPTGRYDRYQCNARDKNDKYNKQSGVANSVQPIIITDGLQSCIAIHIISRRGAIMVHIPPYVRDIINGGPAPDKVNKRQADLIKKAAKKLKSDHLSDMGNAAGVTVVVITGPLSDGRTDDNARTVNKLFGLLIDKSVAQINDPHLTLMDGAGRSTTVYTAENPPVLLNENTAVDIAVPS